VEETTMMAFVPGTGPSLRPWGLIGAVILTLAIERFGLHNNPAFLSMHAANWQFADRYVESRSRGSDILCFGDSLLKFGLLPPVLRAQTGLSSYNFAVTVGPAPASYFLFRRALEHGAHPKAVLVDYVGGIQKEGPSSPTLKYPWADLLRMHEAFELAWVSGQADLFTRTMLGRMFPSYKDRFELRARILAALRGVANDRAVAIAVFRRNWKTNDGGQANVKVAFEDPPPPQGSTKSTWTCDPINEIFIRRFMALASEHKIPVYWVIPPLSPMAQVHNTYHGDDQRFVDFVGRMQASFPNVVVLDGRPSGLDRTFFIDDRHLDLDGAAALTAGIGDVLARRLPEKQRGPRWIELTKLSTRPGDIAVEDRRQSSAVFKVRMGGSRR
jgi:hypothetical protein